MSEPIVPPIFTYAADSPETPARIRYAAAMDQSGPGMHWICFGGTREEARDKLRVAWLKCEAERPRKPPKAKGEPVPAAVDPDEDVI